MTGPSSDIRAATSIARNMICNYGMSELLGPVAYQYTPERTLPVHAQTTIAAIDAEVKRIIDECYENVLKLLREHKKELDAIAQALVEKEELSAEEVYALIGMA
jgi:cell division protease FtsH